MEFREMPCPPLPPADNTHRDWRQRLLALDLETTGTNPHADRIVSAALIKINCGAGAAEVTSHDWLANPGVPIPADAERIHGISNEYVQLHGEPVQSVVAQIADLLEQWWVPDMPLVIYNVPFDLTMLDAEMRRHLGRPLAISGPVIDPLCLDRALCDQRRSRKLELVCEFRGVKIAQAHNSTEDALAAARLAFKIAATSLQIGESTLAELQYQQREWYSDQEQAFGWARETVRAAWPLQAERNSRTCRTPRSLGRSGTPRPRQIGSRADSHANSRSEDDRLGRCPSLPGVLPCRESMLHTLADLGARRFEELNPKHRPSQASPLPDPVRVETPYLEPGLRDWKAPTYPPNEETTVEVVVQQRSGLFASASTVELGVGGVPVERRVSDAAALFGPKGKRPFGLWRVTVPSGRHLGLDPRLPLPSQHMLWDAPSSFWSTTQGIESLTESVSSGGAGISPGNLEIDPLAWIWKSSVRVFSGKWGEAIRAALKEARAEGDQHQIDRITGCFSEFLGELDSPPSHRRSYLQPAWAAAIRANMRRRALRYATVIATWHGIYPIAAPADDTLTYRLPTNVPATALAEDSNFNGKYSVVTG